MAEKKGGCIPLYYVNYALRAYLESLYKPKSMDSHTANSVTLENPWKLVGMRPYELGAVADQMISNGSYFTSYACAGTYRLLSQESGGLGDMKSRRALCAGLWGKARRTTNLARSVTKKAGRGAGAEAAPSARLGNVGRLRLSEKGPGYARAPFFDEWILPPADPETERFLETYLERFEGEEVSKAAAAFRGVLERMLGEMRFYRRLIEEAERSEASGRRGRELVLLDDYRTLLPIWVYTQRTHAYEEHEGLPVNLYNLDFWSYRPYEDDGAVQGTVPVLIEDLLACFARDRHSVDLGLVERFDERAAELFDRCVLDDKLGAPDDDFDAGRAVDSPTVEELFGRLRSGERDVVPAWAHNRAELIWLIMVSCCVGLKEALGPSDISTADGLMLTEGRLGSAELGRGSGVVPLSKVVGKRDAGSFDLRLDDAAKDGVVCVLGREYKTDFWNRWQVRAKELLEEFFCSETHLDEEGVDSLATRVRSVAQSFDARDKRGARRLGDYARLGAVSSGRLDVAETLRGLALDALRSCLDASFAADLDAGQDSLLDLGTRERWGEETLLGAARAAAEALDSILAAELEEERADEYALAMDALRRGDLNEEERAFEERRARNRRDARIPSVCGAVQESLNREFKKYFDEQRSLRSRGEDSPCARSRLDVLLDRLEDEYAVEHGHDPAMRFAVARLRDVLSMVVSPSRVKAISRRRVVTCVEEVFSSVAKGEECAFALIASPDVSARHAVLYLEGGHLMLADSGSLQGTAVLREKRETREDGSTEVHEEAFLLEGTARRRDDMRSASWMSGSPCEVATIVLRRGDVVRLAGRSAVVVGSLA